MPLWSFMYCGKLTTAEPAILLDILMVADKFEVPSCMRDCSQLLTSFPMTTESALLYLDHPCSILTPATVHHLIVAAKDFLAKKYSAVHKFQDEVMNMSLAGIEAIFSSTDLQVVHEDCLYGTVPRTGRKTHMAYGTLRGILTCTDNDIDHEQITKRVTEVLLCKAYPAHRPDDLAACATSSQQFAERAYKYRHLKLVAFDQPCPQVIAYMDLKREECSKLFPSEQICSHPFYVAGQGFFLLAGCSMVEQSGSFRFGIFLNINLKPKGSTCVSVNYEFAARTRPSTTTPSPYADGPGRRHSPDTRRHKSMPTVLVGIGPSATYASVVPRSPSA
uniref:BTB domain-containing protein n=1 Tax=Aegilops tauschii TaxID=37682 RepID=N1QS60_AEGTA